MIINNSKKTQASMEYLFVFGFIFVLVMAAFSSIWFYQRKAKNINDAEEASAMLANAADDIYGLAAGSKKIPNQDDKKPSEKGHDIKIN